MADTPNLGGAFGLPPERAIAWFEGKGNTVAWDWRQVARATAAYVFSVAGVARADVLTTIRDALQSALINGTTFADFQRQMRERLSTLGWWGRQSVVNLDTGEVKGVNLSSPRRLETIYRTNLQSAYMAGRYKALKAMMATRPYWEYVAVMDNRTRPSHAALNGRVYRATDPIWDVIFPPNDYNCRCRVRGLTAQDVKDRNIAISDSTGKIPWIDVRQPDGTMMQRAVIDAGGGIKFSPGLGFARNPATAAPWGDVALPDRLVVLGESAATAAMQEFALAPVKLAAWRDWVDDALASPVQHRWQVLGYVDVNTMVGARAFAKDAGSLIRTPIDWPIQIEDSLLGGLKAIRHGVAQNALSAVQWRDLPALVSKARAALIQRNNGNVVYVLDDPADASMRIKVVVELGRHDTRAGITGNSVRGAFSVQAASLRDANQFEMVWGTI